MGPSESGKGPTRRTLARSIIHAQPATPGTDGVVSLLERLCLGLCDHLQVAGAAVHLMSAVGSEGVAAASDNRSRALVELEFTTGEGPSREAFAGRRPVLVPDVEASGEQRWLGFASALIEEGVTGIFAFPLHVGAVDVGVLEVLVDERRVLSEDDMAMALTFARIATEILLDGRLTTSHGDLDPALASALDGRAEIHQAQGMLMVTLRVSLVEALVRMRAHAFSNDRPLVDLAREIIAGRKFAEDEL